MATGGSPWAPVRHAPSTLQALIAGEVLHRLSIHHKPHLTSTLVLLLHLYTTSTVPLPCTPPSPSQEAQGLFNLQFFFSFLNVFK